MSLDAIIWLALAVAGVCLSGYLLVALVHPEKW